MPHQDDIFDDEEELEPIEAYCVKCRETIEMEDPQAVWTRKGAPGTRGTCPMCASTVFRMGKTDAHSALKKPNAIKVAEGTSHTKQSSARQAVQATYVAYTDADAPFVHQLANDLNNMGVPTYVPRATNGDVAWAGGVHPALEDCTQLLVVLSPDVLDDDFASEAWDFFRTNKKRIVVAQVASVDPPDAIRRAQRIDFSVDYRPALRALVQALAE
jgi:hypothetical protein